jgi:hypothetical protein
MKFDTFIVFINLNYSINIRFWTSDSKCLIILGEVAYQKKIHFFFYFSHLLHKDYNTYGAEILQEQWVLKSL